MPEPKGSLDHLGEFLMHSLRDRGIAFFDTLSEGGWKAPSLLPLQRDLRTLSDEQRAVVRRIVIGSIDAALHDSLFAIQEAHDREMDTVQLHVDGENPASFSDGLQGELFGENGWYHRFSAFGEAD